MAQVAEQLLAYNESHLWRNIQDNASEKVKLQRSRLGRHKTTVRTVARKNPKLAQAEMETRLLSVVKNVAESDTLNPENSVRTYTIHDRYD